MLLPDDEKNIGSLHTLLSRISDPGQTLMLEKGIPATLVASQAARDVLSPPAPLLKAIVCDRRHLDRTTASQPVYAGGTWAQETIKLKRSEGVPEWVAPRFGYSDAVFIHRPASSVKAGDADAALTALAMGFRRMADRHRS